MVLDITTQGNTGFTGSDDQRLQGKLSSGIRSPAMRHHQAGAAGGDHAELAGADRRRVLVSTPVTAPLAASRVMPVTAQFWMISTPERTGRPGIAPGDGIVPRHPAAALQRGAEHRVAACRRRYSAAGRRPCAWSGVSHSLSMPASRLACTWRLNDLHVVHVVRQHHHPARAEHHVVVQLGRQALPTASPRGRTARRFPANR